MSLIINDKVIVGPGNSPYVGDNGNWFVGRDDTGVTANTKIKYVTSEQFKQLDKIGAEGLYFVYDYTDGTIQIYHIDVLGKPSLVVDNNVQLLTPSIGERNTWMIGNIDTGIPADSSVTIAGTTIDDSDVDPDKTWSSNKIRNELKSMEDSVIPGKSLEFAWENTKLGIRNVGKTEYDWRELLGAQGMTGIDGSSVINAQINDDGHLLLTMQDSASVNDTSKLLNVGVVTAEDIINIKNSIARINKEISGIKTSHFSNYSVYNTSTDGEYSTILSCTGTGYCQVIISPFTGRLVLSVDGVDYSLTVQENAVSGSDQSVMCMNDMGESSLLSIIGNQLVLSPMFSTKYSRALQINFRSSFELKILVNNNSKGLYPTVLRQGQNYASTSDPDSDDYIPTVLDMTTDEIDSVMGLI